MQTPNKVIHWLLEVDNPPVRYLTLTNLLNKPETAAEVQQAKARLMEYQVTKAILDHADEFLGENDRLKWDWNYTNKYWQIIFLSQFMADSKDPRIARGVDEILANRKWIKKSGAQCLTATILAALMRLGYTGHPVVEKETEALANRLMADDGIICNEMDNSLLSHCCMALPKLLLCFAEVPIEKRSKAITAAIKLLVNKLVEKEVYVYVPANRRMWQKILGGTPKRADLPKEQTVKSWIHNQKNKFISTHGLGDSEPKKGWLKFGFPLHYNSDILEAMYSLAIHDAPMSSNLQKPLQVIQDKMTPEGKWILENSMNGKMLVNVEDKGKPSKWLTYFALYVLTHFSVDVI